MFDTAHPPPCVQADEEVLYALGLTAAKNLAELKLLLQPSEAKLVGQALTDALSGSEREDFDWSKYGPQVGASGRRSAEPASLVWRSRRRVRAGA